MEGAFWPVFRFALGWSSVDFNIGASSVKGYPCRRRLPSWALPYSSSSRH
jgi:hypothetical protein